VPVAEEKKEEPEVTLQSNTEKSAPKKDEIVVEDL
jgi:hypothetical protein